MSKIETDLRLEMVVFCIYVAYIPPFVSFLPGFRSCLHPVILHFKRQNCIRCSC
ncbi:uncharacterized protein BDW43DRAFT_286080 [Aspergillus alliaceus]|uniref:uncharacterized protein n=1 Tax=Petromyces alliaceus TaxID=209559 RepID=UPI0012A7259B|nr:uncharacterized protein BDW43DRAFT_286080 [Aspergillus alliaceus]KAB8230310.1 hypothetical protein BDW43DRAFT_286080 [Aspergillus alliaceus]